MFFNLILAFALAPNIGYQSVLNSCTAALKTRFSLCFEKGSDTLSHRYYIYKKK